MNKKGYLNQLMLAALALLMSFSVSLKAYAADVVTVDTVRAAWLAGDSSIKLSDYYLIYNTTRSQWGSTFDCVLYMLCDSGYEGDLFIYIDEDSSPVSGNYVGMTYYNGEYKTASDAGVYTRSAWYDAANGTQYGSATGYGFGIDMQYIQPGQMDTDFRFGSTNIPLFSSLEAAKSFFDSGDTSGLINGSDCSYFDSDIETPKDFQINFSTSQIFDDKGFFNECDFQFTWKQSEDTDLNGYQTEIYIQATHCKVSITNLFGSADSREQKLGDKLLISSASTSYDNKASIKWNDLVAYLNKDGTNLFGASNAGGVCCTYPIYFWVRNVKGNTYGDWIKVTVTPDNVVVDGNDYLGTGKGTVSHGYELVDGSGNGDQKESQYGQGYHVDIPYTSTNAIIDYIKSGFGLLGDNGLIAFFKDMFSFLPDPVWTIIFTMVGVCAIIIIIKVAK